MLQLLLAKQAPLLDGEQGRVVVVVVVVVGLLLLFLRQRLLP